MRLLHPPKAISFQALIILIAALSFCFSPPLAVLAEGGVSLDLVVTKKDASPGDIIGYTITFANSSFENVENVQITLDYDEQRLTPYDISGGVQSVGNIVYALERLAQKTTQVKTFWFTIHEQLPSGTTVISAVARLTADSMSSLITSTVITNVQAKPVLVTTVIANQDAVRGGDLITYTISYRNDGNAIARGVVLIDDFDEQNADVMQTNSGGSVRAGEVRWNIGDFYPNQKATQSVTLRVRSSARGDTLANMVSLIGDNATRFDYSTHTTLLHVTGGIDTLRVRISASDENEYRVTSHTAHRGERIDVEVTLTNYSGSRADGILVALRFDPLYFDILDSQGGIREGNNLYWEIDQLERNGMRSWNPVFQVASRAPYHTPLTLSGEASARNFQTNRAEAITTIVPGAPHVKASVQESPRTGSSALLSILIVSLGAGLGAYLWSQRRNADT
ncbi:MAG: hypothetical protein AB1352_03635 [Patescibacteria group bacterium]